MVDDALVLPVVVVHYRAPEWCRSAVAAIGASAGVITDVLVVDNSGELADGGVDGATVLPAHGNTGYAGGANLGLRHALERHPAAPVVAVCAHDFHPDPACFRSLLDAAAADATLGVIAPRLTGPKPSIGNWFDGRRSVNVEPHPDAPAVFESDWVSGTCLCVRRDVLAATGGLDEGFGSYMEDVDLCLRARDAGWRVGAVVAATGRGMGSVSDVRFRMTAANVALLAAKREGARAAWTLVATYLGRSLRGLALAVLPSTRGIARRRASLRHARSRGGAAWDLVRAGRIRTYAREPHHFVPTFDLGARSEA